MYDFKLVKFVDKKNYNFAFYLIAILIFFAFLGFTATGEDGLIRLYQLKKTKDNLEEKNRALLLENLTYRQELKSLHNPDTLSYHAHESPGLVYPNEIVYVTSGQK